jgi:hypothetical protein
LYSLIFFESILVLKSSSYTFKLLQSRELIYSHKTHIIKTEKYPYHLKLEKKLKPLVFKNPCKIRKTKPNDESNTIETEPEWPNPFFL